MVRMKYEMWKILTVTKFLKDKYRDYIDIIESVYG